MNEIEQIQELMSSYRIERIKCLNESENPKSPQTPGYWLGRVHTLDCIISDLREIVLNDQRSGV